ncbi:helix-turn-helix transcriptional regulator [Lentzea flava]|uniref:LuxR family transcriptional regulator n=1 Tax=Lentzea flava TaxID=103732 RepID=A0ABQ2UG84_9PSEU|nr:LuxR family transcriptional regulator [Lentzea flava]MCP2198202.1 regulatory protein, luxR family [Lentzea flava]GGU30928.1 LuxR family transcriptional regulator [Lentzea flava]
MQTRAPHVVGRDREVTALAGALGRIRDGRGGAIFLTGEAGIGKSRLARYAAGQAYDRGIRVLKGRGTTIGPMVPFRPIAEALLALFRGEPPDDAALGPYKPVLGTLIPEWHDSRSTTESVVVLAEAVLRLLASVARKTPCLLVLEDLHDADAETLAVIEYLADNLEDQPVGLLATIRTEPGHALELVHRIVQRGAATRLDLHRLTRQEVRQMTAACLESEQIPQELCARLWTDSAGNPFLIEELLHGMVSSGLLVSGTRGWQVVGELKLPVPAAFVRSVAHRTDRLGPQGREVLSIAAVLGHRFPLSVVQRVTGTDDRQLLSHLHAGVAAQLVTPDEPAPDWYAFRHPLTADALLAQLTPAERADLSRRTADAIEELHPGLAGDWCPLVAKLRLDAGSPDRAGLLFAEAGTRALAGGAAGSAVTVLDRAQRLLTGEARADVLDALIPALAETGEFERAFELEREIADLRGLDGVRRAKLHMRLARVAHLAGRFTDGVEQVRVARTLLGQDAPDELTAQLDVNSAYLTLNIPSADRIESAACLARRAAEAAARADLPDVACEAWQLLGIIAREQDIDEANRCFDSARALADAHQLPIQRIYALVRLAGNDWLASGDTAALGRVHDEACRAGAITVAYNVNAIMALQHVLTGDYERAEREIDSCLEATGRLKFHVLTRYLLMVKATLAGHRGNRAETDDATRKFEAVAKGGAQEVPLCHGLARAFCALLEEDHALAVRELDVAEAKESQNPTTFHLSGTHGLRVLLAVLDGRFGWSEYTVLVKSSAAGMRWNRQFADLAHAVLLGRDGRRAEALDAFERAQDAAAPYPMARHLGLRLIAREAAEWGDPVTWLRAAEEHFHQAGIPAVASACRGLLRQAGVPVQQRRTGTDQVPKQLRGHGVTVREFEVFVLLADRMGNKAIGTRLHISPRTVEKHVASLIAKTGQPDRESLSAYAAALGR